MHGGAQAKGNSADGSKRRDCWCNGPFFFLFLSFTVILPFSTLSLSISLYLSFSTCHLPLSPSALCCTGPESSRAPPATRPPPSRLSLQPRPADTALRRPLPCQPSGQSISTRTPTKVNRGRRSRARTHSRRTRKARTIAASRGRSSSTAAGKRRSKARAFELLGLAHLRVLVGVVRF